MMVSTPQYYITPGILYYQLFGSQRTRDSASFSLAELILARQVPSRRQLPTAFTGTVKALFRRLPGRQSHERCNGASVTISQFQCRDCQYSILEPTSLLVSCIVTLTVCELVIPPTLDAYTKLTSKRLARFLTIRRALPYLDAIQKSPISLL